MKDFTRVSAAVPPVKIADCVVNEAVIEDFFSRAVEKGAEAVVFPELCLTGATCGDIFLSPALLDSALKALEKFASSTAHSPGVVAVIGLPLRAGGRVYDCAAVVESGSVKGFVPKSVVDPSTDGRWFAPASTATSVKTVEFSGSEIPFGTDLIFTSGNVSYAVEIGSDSVSPIAPAVNLALAGADIILSPSAAPETAARHDHRLEAIRSRSDILNAGYVYAGAGAGESSTDYVFSGPAVIAENGAILADGERFDRDGSIASADIDVGFIEFERSRNPLFKTVGPQAIRRVALAERFVVGGDDLLRDVDPAPFVPSDPAALDRRVSEVLEIQSSALATRLKAIRCKKIILGISGGLDSALALIVAVETFKKLGYDTKDILALTMPGFGTTGRTKGNAEKLCEGFGVTLETVDITASVKSHFNDIGHDESVQDITYENAQARARTFILMDKANQTGALLIGTGDLSELALGWCTYNGDHMSMYGVNAGVPKTLVKAIVGHYALSNPAVRDALTDIVATPVSPELLPASDDGTIAQITEDKVGPYELHDFFIYHFLRRGATKRKILFLAVKAFAGKYDKVTVEKWLEIFFRRFLTQQFKRSSMPDAPAVGSVGLSPRGAWAMPSDMGFVEL
ncbi:MAG: NAD(+) synthase [Kiritimatiellae bacterium]|nr:NAD(+) synthase [Kiritimatiellia bacterium]